LLSRKYQQSLTTAPKNMMVGLD